MYCRATGGMYSPSRKKPKKQAEYRKKSVPACIAEQLVGCIPPVEKQLKKQARYQKQQVEKHLINNRDLQKIFSNKSEDAGDLPSSPATEQGGPEANKQEEHSGLRCHHAVMALSEVWQRHKTALRTCTYLQPNFVTF